MPNRRSYTDDQLIKALIVGRNWADVMVTLGKARTTVPKDVRAYAQRLGLDTERLDQPHIPSDPILGTIGNFRNENSSSVGTRSEAVVMTALILARYKVLLPFGSGHRYDFVVDKGDGNFVRVQCKTGRLHQGCVIFSARSVRRDRSPMLYHGDIDAFGVFCLKVGKVYLVPIKDINGTEGRLRIEATKGQRIGIRWAAPYEVSNFNINTI